MKKIELNGKPRDCASATISELLDEAGFQGSIVATALNGEFVPRNQRDTTPLSEGDRVEVLSPMQGG